MAAGAVAAGAAAVAVVVAAAVVDEAEADGMHALEMVFPGVEVVVELEHGRGSERHCESLEKETCHVEAGHRQEDRADQVGAMDLGQDHLWVAEAALGKASSVLVLEDLLDAGVQSVE